MPTQIFYINTHLVYVRHLFRYFLYVAHAIPRTMVCWIARVVLRASPHVVFACHLCGSCASPRVVRASGSRDARISRVDHVCRAAFEHDSKLFSLINSHINNVT
jgi:hypothetical protein